MYAGKTKKWVCSHGALGVLRRHENGMCVLCKREYDNQPHRKAIVSKSLKSKYASDTQFRETTKQRSRLRIVHPLEKRRNHIKSRYGLTLDCVDRMLEEQNQACALCGVVFDLTHTKALCIDHCHRTGVVRGLLCHNCNTALGVFEKNAFRHELFRTYASPLDYVWDAA